MTSSITILTDDECAMLDEIAARRNAEKRQFYQSIGRNYDAKASNVATHRLGIGAEYAVAAVLGAHWDDRVLRGGNKRGWDVQSSIGTIDVKYRRSIGYSYTLDSTKPEEFKADYGVLVWPTRAGVPGRDYWIVGGISRFWFHFWAREALAGHGHRVQIEDWGYGARLVMRAGHMLPFKTVLELAEVERRIQRERMPVVERRAA